MEPSSNPKLTSRNQLRALIKTWVKNFKKKLHLCFYENHFTHHIMFWKKNFKQEGIISLVLHCINAESIAFSEKYEQDCWSDVTQTLPTYFDCQFSIWC